MKKKLLIVCLIILVFSVGCVNKKTNNNSSNSSSNDITEKGYNLDLTDTSSFKKLSYKYPHDVTISSLGTYTMLIYNKDDGSQLFKIGITKFDNMSVDDAMQGASATKVATKNYNGIDWVQFDSGGNNSYVYQYNNDTYNISFLYDEDLSDFEDNFMKNVTFN